MSIRFASAFLLVALALGAPASQAASQGAAAKPSARQCFYARDVDGFSAVDRQHVYVRVRKDVYAFELFGTCPDVDWSLRVGLVSRSGGFICSGLDADLLVPSTLGPQRCPVQNIRKLSPDEIAALPRKARP